MIPTASIRTYRGLEKRLRSPVRPVVAETRVSSGLSAAEERVFGALGGAAAEGAGPGTELGTDVGAGAGTIFIPGPGAIAIAGALPGCGGAACGPP